MTGVHSMEKGYSMSYANFSTWKVNFYFYAVERYLHLTAANYNLYKGLHATSFHTGKLVCALPTPQVLHWLHSFNFYSMTNKHSAYLCPVCEWNEGNLHHPNWWACKLTVLACSQTRYGQDSMREGGFWEGQNMLECPRVVVILWGGTFPCPIPPSHLGYGPSQVISHGNSAYHTYFPAVGVVDYC